MKLKETLDHHLEIYGELECISTYPILAGKTETYKNLEHYKGLNAITKGLTNPMD